MGGADRSGAHGTLGFLRAFGCFDRGHIGAACVHEEALRERDFSGGDPHPLSPRCLALACWFALRRLEGGIAFRAWRRPGSPGMLGRAGRSPVIPRFAQRQDSSCLLAGVWPGWGLACPGRVAPRAQVGHSHPYPGPEKPCGLPVCPSCLLRFLPAPLLRPAPRLDASTLPGVRRGRQGSRCVSASCRRRVP